MTPIKSLRILINEMLSELSLAKRSLKQAKGKEEKTVLRIADTEEAQKIAQLAAQAVQQSAHNQIAAVATKSLQAVFDEPYEFRILFEQKRGKTEARLVFARDGQEFNPLEETGGGAVDIAAFALRVAAILLSRPQKQRLLVMDEPFRFVSVEYRERVLKLMQKLAKDLDFQFIIVTHMPEFKKGHVIEL